MYAEYFGFRDEPFNVTPDPRFFYENPMYREAYANLSWGIGSRKGFMSLIGEVGTGKTTLLRRLMANLEAAVRFVFIPSGMLSSDDLLSFTCAELGLSSSDGGWPHRVEALKTFLVGQLESGGTTALLVDEAQHLGEDALEKLRLLSNLEMPGQKLLQILLVGQPELAAKLDQPQLRPLKQRIALQCRLDRLRYREIGQYIEYRLSAAGHPGGELFSPDAIQEIGFYSNGIPRLINIICENALLTAYTTSRRQVSSDIIREVARDLRVGPSVIGVGASDWHSQGRLTRGVKATAQSGAAERTLATSGPRARRATSTWEKRRRPSVVPFGFHLGWLRGSVGALALVLLVGSGVSVWRPDGSVLAAVKQGLESLGREVGIWTHGQMARARSQGTTTSEPPETTSRAGAPSVPKASESALAPAASARVMSPPILAGEAPEGSERNGHANARAAASVESPHAEKTEAKPASDAVDSGRQTRYISIERGSTISEIARSAYGPQIFLALDLLKEFNPHIENLNWVLAGQRLQLPAITRQTLLRQQPDGTYSLILASRPSLVDADTLSHAVRARGYEVRVTRRSVSDNLSLYRVEIEGLRDERAADRAWEVAHASSWLPVSANL